MKFLMILTTAILTMDCISQAGEPAVATPVKVEQAEKHLASGAQLLDVRTKEEWDEGHLKGAILATVTEEGFLAKAKAHLIRKRQWSFIAEAAGAAPRRRSSSAPPVSPCMTWMEASPPGRPPENRW